MTANPEAIRLEHRKDLPRLRVILTRQQSALGVALICRS